MRHRIFAVLNFIILYNHILLETLMGWNGVGLYHSNKTNKYISVVICIR